MASKLKDLHIDLPHPGQPVAKKPVADSWEDEDDGDSTPTDTITSPILPTTSNQAPNPPPPTPISPTGGHTYDWSTAEALGGGRPQPRSNSGTSTPRSDGGDGKRPEKTTAAASRMIAAGLGVRAPKKTEEQRKYERAVKEQEIKRKMRERENLERERVEDERAKAAVWDS
jgi:hypothetical protein